MIPGVGAMDFILVSNHGLGDTYLIASHCASFKRVYCTQGQKLHLIVKNAHLDLARRFAGPDQIIGLTDAELGNLNQGHQSIVQGHPFYVHPSTITVRADHCVAHHFMHDTAMYAMLLGLPPSTPPALPAPPNADDTQEACELAEQFCVEKGNTVFFVPQARSWPASIPDKFWGRLDARLRVENRGVVWNEPSRIPLRCVETFAELCGWVIGANCGLMQILVQGRAHCRKTVLTQDLTVPYVLPVHPAFAYHTMRRVDGNAYDIEEYRVRLPNGQLHDPHAQLIEVLVRGRNALGPEPKYEPLTRIETLTTPGEIIDKHTIVLVKLMKLPHKAHMLRRELETLREQRENIVYRWPKVANYEEELMTLNEIAWTNNEILIQTYAYDLDPAFWDKKKGLNVLRAFGEAHRANQQRIRVKNRIDQICGAGYREEKSYD